MKLAWIAMAAALLLAGCGGEADAKDAPKAPPASSELGTISSVIELRDALVAAGYDCPTWTQDNVVKLAAESGSCDDSSVLSTFASEGDRQAQLDIDKGMSDMLSDADIEEDPTLVGPNWMFKSPEASKYASKLGGTIVGPHSG